MLRGLLEKRSASFAVIYGGRRIGKSRLVEEFGRNLKCIPLQAATISSHKVYNALLFYYFLNSNLVLKLIHKKTSNQANHDFFL